MDQIRITGETAHAQPAESSSTVDDGVAANSSPATTRVASTEHASVSATAAPSANGHVPHNESTGNGGNLAAPAHGTPGHNGSELGFMLPLHATPDAETGEVTRHAARHYYRQTIADGRPCTGRQLADRFGRSERWGRYQIRAASP